MIDRYRFILLETIIVGMVLMGIGLGLGSVKEETSFGLRDVLQILGVVAGALCTFQGGPRPPTKDDIWTVDTNLKDPKKPEDEPLSTNPESLSNSK